jgi:hypothetical protein
MQMDQFMKNLSLIGTMLYLIARRCRVDEP